MSKKKRLRRDIEKYQRSGRYWDLLRLMESEGLVPENAEAYREAWNTITRQALLQERAFEQFYREIDTLRSVPRDPDCRLLVSLKEFIEGEGKTEKLVELKGLSSHGESVRSKVIAFASEGIQEGKLRGVLEHFIREPGKITLRSFEQAAALVPVESLRAGIIRLGESINVARRLNQKTAVSRGWKGISLSGLGWLDNRLERISRTVPDGLLDILLFPYIYNLSVMCRRLAPEMSIQQASQLLDSIPFLLPRLAGEKLGKLEQKNLTSRSRPVPGKDDSDSLRRKTAGLSIEEKLTALRDTRLRVEDARAGEMGLDDLGFDEDFDGDDDSDFALPGKDEVGKASLARELLAMHHAVLEDIAVRASGMPPREKKELIRVMERILFRDLNFILDMTDNPESTVELLDSAIAAGCGGVRTGLLAFLASTAMRRGDVRRRAEKHLDQSAAPDRQDMEWLAGEWSEIYYPYVQALRPILARYKNDTDLMAPFPEHLCRLLEFDMYEAAMMRGAPSFLREMLETGETKNPVIMRRELSVLTEYEVLNPVREYLRCFPGDKPTIEGELCWLKVLYSRSPDAVWKRIADELRRCGEMKSDEELFSKSIEKMVNGKIEAVLLFMREHPDELLKLPADMLDPIFDEIIGRPRILRNHFKFLVWLEKLFGELAAADATSFQPFKSRLRQILKELAAPVKKSSKSKKGKR